MLLSFLLVASTAGRDLGSLELRAVLLQLLIGLVQLCAVPAMYRHKDEEDVERATRSRRDETRRGAVPPRVQPPEDAIGKSVTPTSTSGSEATSYLRSGSVLGVHRSRACLEQLQLLLQLLLLGRFVRGGSREGCHRRRTVTSRVGQLKKARPLLGLFHRQRVECPGYRED